MDLSQFRDHPDIIDPPPFLAVPDFIGSTDIEKRILVFFRNITSYFHNFKIALGRLFECEIDEWFEIGFEMNSSTRR